MSQYRAEFGQYLSDKSYSRALKLYTLAKDPRTYSGDANNASYALNKLLSSEPQPKLRQRQPAPPLPPRKNNQRNTASYWDTHVNSDPNRRAKWQQQSNQLHSQKSATAWPTGPRPARPISRRKEKPNDMMAVYIFFFLLLLYVIFK